LKDFSETGFSPESQRLLFRLAAGRFLADGAFLAALAGAWIAALVESFSLRA
jgi:hypothetical protein